MTEVHEAGDGDMVYNDDGVCDPKYAPVDTGPWDACVAGDPLCPCTTDKPGQHK